MSKLLCKIKPGHNTCCGCLDIQVDNDVVLDCNKCARNIDGCEILGIGHSFWKGDWAMVLMKPDGIIERVSLSRVYDVRRVE